ncbi:VOC family protein [Pseudomonas abieticivorans]|uniref:VOC family protein n=1 Tax=Pseudomonas abieticivorans TaxID=2931382 RepID=UPI0020BEC75C|nr:VOC family protein [Pseudomonas sp. PIA16]
MFSHIQVGARDLPRMVDFYEQVLGELGLERMADDSDSGPPGIGWQLPGQDWPQFFVQQPFNGLPATWGNGAQVSFMAPSQAAVEAAWRRALELGGSDEGAPGLRPQYRDDYYSAYCRDPEGNKLCFVHVGAFDV